jgi:indole-3-glycerol phosphate synthase / phosphoribosylanthranilate isomerase
MTGILDQILQAKRKRLAEGEFTPRTERIQAASDGARFARSLAGSGPRVIAEVKHRSPSAGLLLVHSEVEAVAREYRRGGAAAISVVIEQDFFGGDPEWLPMVKRASGLPVLMKDFVIEEVQLDWALSLGADAVLLIVSALDDPTLMRLHRAARDRGLAVLVEAHDADEVRRALACGAEIVGINSRNLSTFAVDLPAMALLASEIPAGVTRVAESGIRSRADVERLSEFQAFLVGESLLRSGDRVRSLRELTGIGATRVKVCGVTREEDARACVASGVDLVGLNFSPLSKRRVDLDRASALLEAALGVEGVVAVFAGNTEREIREIAETLRPDVLQLTDPPAAFSGAPWPVPVWQTVTVGREDLAAACAWPAEALLFDTAVDGEAGGTGKAFDWSSLVSLRLDRPFLVAGGLKSDNVGTLIERLHPWGVDAASGLETAPGRKDPVKIEAFVRAVRRPEKDQP